MPSNFFNGKFQKMFQTGLIGREILFRNGKLTSIGTAFCLSKTIFTHFDCDCLELPGFYDSEIAIRLQQNSDLKLAMSKLEKKMKFNIDWSIENMKVYVNDVIVSTASTHSTVLRGTPTAGCVRRCSWRCIATSTTRWTSGTR